MIAATPSSTSTAWRRLAVNGLLTVAAMAREMTFIEHLEELRRRILWAVVCLAVTFAACWMFAGDLYEIARAPLGANPAVTLSLSRPQDIVGLHVKVTLVASIFFASPLILIQAWLFISPGLHPHERRYAIPFVLSASVLFMIGGAFGYFLAFPAALKFLLDWIVASNLTPIIDAVEYFDLFFTIMVALGIVFQIPAVIFVLSRIGLVSARLLAHYFRHAVLACIVIAAVITPTTDFGNMLIIAGPMIVLYIAGIAIAWLFGKKRIVEDSES